MYEAVDQSWRDRPSVMSPSTLAQLAARIAEHAIGHEVAAVRVVLHGGEPLLAGRPAITQALKVLHDTLAPVTGVSFAVQTNGVLLDDPMLEVLRPYRVRIGVSIDGGRTANDRHRRTAAGRSSFDAVVTGIDRLRRPENRQLYGGLLCTVDLANDATATYDSLLAHEPPTIDFCLPHGNWEYPPPGIAARAPGRPAGGTPYADWLITIFDRWYAEPRRRVGIRLFDSIISLLLGGPSGTEAIGPGVPTSVVVETDGSIEGNDALKTTAPSGAATGLDVFRHSFDEVIRSPMIAAARAGLSGLGPACRRCGVVGVCGGGLHAHRYSRDQGFDRPSIYCADLYRLVTHIRARVESDLSALGARIEARQSDGGSM